MKSFFTKQSGEKKFQLGFLKGLLTGRGQTEAYENNGDFHRPFAIQRFVSKNCPNLGTKGSALTKIHEQRRPVG